MNRYTVEAVGFIGVFTEYNEIELVPSTQVFDIHLPSVNLDSPEVKQEMIIKRAIASLGDYHGRRYDFAIYDEEGQIIKDWEDPELAQIFSEQLELEYQND